MLTFIEICWFRSRKKFAMRNGKGGKELEQRFSIYKIGPFSKYNKILCFIVTELCIEPITFSEI